MAFLRYLHCMDALTLVMWLAAVPVLLYLVGLAAGLALSFMTNHYGPAALGFFWPYCLLQWVLGLFRREQP